VGGLFFQEVPMQTVLDNCDAKMRKSVAALSAEFSALRTGRATAALFDKIKVDYYGQETPLSQVASISVPEARLVVIQPWDKTLLSPIEKAILKSELSLNPNNDGKLLRINFPPLTEQRRKDLAKNAKNLAEQSRVAIRNIRREAMEDIKKLQKSGAISEDQQKEAETKTQKMTDSYVNQINALAVEKEKEIMEI
jgi:ribosome recycling factor